MKVAEILHFGTNKLFSSIDAEKFGYAFGNSDIFSEYINGIRARFGVKSNDVLSTFIHDNQKIFLTIMSQRARIYPIDTQICAGVTSSESISQLLSKRYFRRR